LTVNGSNLHDKGAVKTWEDEEHLKESPYSNVMKHQKEKLDKNFKKRRKKMEKNMLNNAMSFEEFHNHEKEKTV
jgi:hypothetical protein